MEVALGTLDEPRPSLIASLEQVGVLGAETGKASQLQSIEDVMLFQKAEIGIASTLQLIA